MFDLTQLPDQFPLLVEKKMEISSHIKFFFLQTQVSQGGVGEEQSKGVMAPSQHCPLEGSYFYNTTVPQESLCEFT